MSKREGEGPERAIARRKEGKRPRMRMVSKRATMGVRGKWHLFEDGKLRGTERRDNGLSSGMPVGSRKCGLLPPGWTCWVDGRSVVSSRGAVNSEAEISGRVRFVSGFCEDPGGPPSERTTRMTSRFTGSSRPSEITFVELLSPRQTPPNSASREFRLLGTYSVAL